MFVLKFYVLPWLIHLGIATGWFVITWQAKDRFWRHDDRDMLKSGQGRLLLLWLAGTVLTPVTAWYWHLPYWGATIGSTMLCGLVGAIYGDTRSR